MSGPTVCGATGPSGPHAINPAPRPGSNTGHAAWHVCRDAEDDPVSVGGVRIGRAVTPAATEGPRDTDAAHVKRGTWDGAARQVSIIRYKLVLYDKS